MAWVDGALPSRPSYMQDSTASARRAIFLTMSAFLLICLVFFSRFLR